MTKALRILVIDDDEAVRSTLCENLQHYGCETIGAADGFQGIEFLSQHAPPDIVITDIIMPHKEGLETIMEIRRRFPSVKLIAISGGGRAKSLDFLDAAEKLGASVVLPKPIDMDELETAIRRLAG